MSSNLAQRVVTAVFGVALLLALVIWGRWFGIFFLTAVLSLAMMYEYSSITFALSDQVEKRYAMLCVTWFVLIADLLSPRSEYELAITSFILLFTYFLFTATRHAEAAFSAHFREFSFAFLGVIYLTFIPLFLPRIHETPAGVNWTILFLLIVWAGDTGAYFAGKKYGKNKLYPLISPMKTREGAMGGLASSLIASVIFKLLGFRELSWIGAIVIPIVVGAVAQVGDLCESFLKRAFDKKDSGSLLPGHGGFLDRFDAIVFSLPVMYALTRLFG